MDYRLWTERVGSFSEALRELPGEIQVSVEIGAPVSAQAIAEVAKKWPTGLPESLRRLWGEGAGQLNCRYVWTPPVEALSRLHEVFESNNYIYGGACFEPAAEIFPGNLGVDSSDKNMEEVLGKEGLALWSRCAVFLHVRNGDCLGLDPESDPDEPAVVYLVHDEDESGVICKSLPEFLAIWQELSYIGPEFWLLDYWLDEDGLLDASTHKTAELRDLLTPRQRG